MGRKVSFRCSIRLHRRLLRPFSDSFSTSTLAIRPCDTPHRFATLQRSLGLIAGRSPTATRNKSPTKQGSCWQQRVKRSPLKGAKSPITMLGRG